MAKAVHVETDAPIWHTLGMLSTIGKLIDHGVVEAREHLAQMQSARERPYVLDDATVARSIALYTDVRDMMWIYEEQLKRWSTASPSIAEQREITRLAAQLPQWNAAVKQILAVDDELKLGTIETVMAKSDVQFGLEALLRLAGRSNE